MEAAAVEAVEAAEETRAAMADVGTDARAFPCAASFEYSRLCFPPAAAPAPAPPLVWVRGMAQAQVVAVVVVEHEGMEVRSSS